MSAPDTSLKKQKRRHVGPIVGITAALIFVGLLFLGYLTYVADTDPSEPAVVETGPEGAMPAEGVPARPLADPDPAPQVIESEPEPLPAD